MTDYKQLYTGVSRAAWGYFFLYFNVNVGTVNLLPAFVGVWLILDGIIKLADEQRDIKLLLPLGYILLVWHSVDWLLTCFGASYLLQRPVVTLLFSVIQIYFHFQLLTDFAALAAKYQNGEKTICQRLLRWRTVHTLMLTLLSLPILEWAQDTAWWEAVAFLLAFIGIIAAVCIMATLFSLRSCLKDEEQPASPEAE